MCFFASNHDQGKVKEVSRSYLNVPFFSFCLTLSSFRVDLAGLMYEEIIQCPELYNKQMKRYRDKNVVSNAWNAGAKDLEFI